jgi:hypothetical protein
MEEQERTENADRAEPELLYHYTDQKGLLGIFGDKEKCIWATHYRYLNDTSEGQIVARLLLQELAGRGDVDAISQAKSISSEIASENVYVTSFSGSGNLLSQWRAYSGDSGGYSIGFSRRYLKAIGMHFLKNKSGRYYSPESPLIRCQYFNDVVEKQLKEKIQIAVDSYISDAKETRRTNPQVVVCAILCKRRSWLLLSQADFSFFFLRPGQLHYWAGCGRRQGRAFFSAFIGAKRRPFTAGAAGRREDHPGRRKSATLRWPRGCGLPTAR